MMCLFAWCQAVLETEFFVEDWGDGAGADNSNSALVEASKRAPPRWDALLTLAVASNEGHRPRCPWCQEMEVPQELRIC